MIIESKIRCCSRCSYRKVCLARSNVVQKLVDLPFELYTENWGENCNNKRDEKVEWVDKLRYAVARTADEFLANTCSYYAEPLLPVITKEGLEMVPYPDEKDK
jgi:hypothetical protein